MENLDERVEISKRNPWVAGLLNGITPGLGYYYCGKFMLGIITALLLPFFYISSDFISIILPPKWNVLFYFSSHFLIPSVFLVHGILIAKRKKLYKLKTPNLIYFYITFFLFAMYYTSSVYKSNFESYIMGNIFMENTVMQDENIMVRLNAYNIYCPFSSKNEILHISTPQRNDVVLYTAPFLDNNRKIVREPILNRIVAFPGDTIKIVDKICFINGKREILNTSYKNDGKILDTSYHSRAIYPSGATWNEDQYGPLYIPKTGDIIKLDSSNIYIWKEVIAMENHLTLNNTDDFFAATLSKGEYKVQCNYYFLMGDNRNNSTDSRVTGLISEEEIKGKAEFITGGLMDLISLLSSHSRIGKIIE